MAKRKCKVVYSDPTTGREIRALPSFVDNLLNLAGLLQYGVENARHVRSILEAMGFDYTEDTTGQKFAEDARQLRYAKEYLVATQQKLIVAQTGDLGGYFLANRWEDVADDIAMCEAMARGHQRRADQLRVFAEKTFGPAAGEKAA